jgi:signal transduction histidine kinase
MMNATAIHERAGTIFRDDLRGICTNTDMVFFWLFLIQWAAAITLAVCISPYAWAGSTRSWHLHLQIAVFGGLALNALPITLIILRPGAPTTRHVVAITQMLWSAIFVHLTGGRIETHFHIFGSLAFLSFYRDPRVLLTATGIVALDHLLLGFFWPESVYGIANPEWWRFLEHAAWVIFEDTVLWVGCRRTLFEMRVSAQREATLEDSMQNIEEQVTQRTAELKTAADRYRNVLENTSAVPWKINYLTCEIFYVAPQLVTVFGLPVSAREATSFLDLLHSDDREPFRRFIARQAAGGASSSAHIDSRIITEDRSLNVRSFVANRDADAVDAGVYGISIDITQQKRLEQELVQAQKLESIGQLSAGIAHEINTPTQFIGDNVRFLHESMTEVFAVLQTLEARTAESTVGNEELTALFVAADVGYFREEVPKAISQSLDGVARISKIVGAMKEFSHPAIDRTPHDLNRAIASTITVASNEWRYVAEMCTDFDPTLPPVTVMPGAFNQVILNILVNAAHAIADAEFFDPDVKGRINVSTRKLADWVEIRIQDSGTGISESIRPRIFDPFFTTKPVGKGTGQGLAIAYDVVVNKHKGTIEVEAGPTGGSTFVIRLPITAMHAPAVAA